MEVGKMRCAHEANCKRPECRYPLCDERNDAQIERDQLRARRVNVRCVNCDHISNATCGHCGERIDKSVKDATDRARQAGYAEAREQAMVIVHEWSPDEAEVLARIRAMNPRDGGGT